MTVPRAVNPASNPLAASVRGRHPLRSAAAAWLREFAEPIAWLCVGTGAIAAWIALVYAVGA